MKDTKLTAGELIIEQARKSKTDVKVPIRQLSKDIIENEYMPMLKKRFIQGKRKYFNRWPWYIHVLMVPETAARFEEIQDDGVYIVTPQKLPMLLKDACPTPNYGEHVYVYNHLIDDIEMVWAIPSKEDCLMYVENQAIIHPEEFPILQQVLAFKNGDLFKKDERA